ncbi:MAG TPA: DNA alkylation repair protein [Puia sp.]|nr:DNA alkylation repair protein [Puia sp.]
MTAKEIMTELKSLGDPGIKKILLKHGVKEPFFGVKVEHLKNIQKKVKKDYQLAKDLYATGNADAMYLAGLIADDEKMTRKDLEAWVKAALSKNIGEYTVPWVASGSKYGNELALEWIDAPEEHIAAAGWATLCGLVSLKPDSELNIPSLKALLARVAKTIHKADNSVRSQMNNFMIAVGAYVAPLSDEAIATAKKVGVVIVDKGDTACKVPDAIEYINKSKARGSLGKKKKTVRC